MTNNNIEIKKRFIEVRKLLDLTQSELANAIGKDKTALSKIESLKEEKRIPTLSIMIAMEEKFNVNRHYIETGEGNMLLANKHGNLHSPPGKEFYNKLPKSDTLIVGDIAHESGESNFIDIGNGQFIMVVPLVPIKAQAGYIQHYDDERYINETFTEKHSFAVSRVYRGKYMAFIIDGDSMDNGIAGEAIQEGSTVTGREIQKTLWRNKFHIHRYKDYVIIHQDGIFTKRITQHDTENGIITCHSLNPDKDKYADFDLNLDDCLQIFNIVNVTQPR